MLGAPSDSVPPSWSTTCPAARLRTLRAGIIPALVGVLAALLRAPGSVAYLATTVRNPTTLDTFLEAATECGLRAVEVPLPAGARGSADTDSCGGAGPRPAARRFLHLDEMHDTSRFRLHCIARAEE